MSLLRLELTTMATPGARETADCTVRIYSGIGTAKGKIIVVASDNGSNSVVANKVEEIAADIRVRFKIEPENLIFIEHRHEMSNFEETYDLVHLQYQEHTGKFTKPRWSAFSKKAVKSITGKEIK